MKKNIVDFLFEAQTLKRLQRTGWQILGGGNRESIAEHSYIVAIISYILAVQLEANLEKVLLMSLFHDFSETRTGDIYKLADLYVQAKTLKAHQDALSNHMDTNRIFGIIKEYENKKSLEAKIVHDADTIALILELKLLTENGNLNAHEWFDGNVKSLKLTQSKKIVEDIKKTNSQDWWRKERKILHQRMQKK